MFQNKECDLVLQSGGLDSTYVLYYILRHHKRNVHVHHIHMKNEENRQLAEQKAIKNNLLYMRKIRNFKFTTSTIDIRNIKRKIRDYNQQLLIAYNIGESLYKYNKIYLYRGLLKKEDNSDNKKLSYKIRDIQSILSRDSKFYPEVISIVNNLTKKDIYYKLPKKIRDNCWYCRRPIYTNGDYNVCNKCFTCKEVNSFVCKTN